MSTRSMSLTGVRVSRAHPLAVTFAPTDITHFPGKHHRMEQIPSRDSSLTAVAKNFVLVRTEETEVKAGFCCPYHARWFAEDFDSEDEEMPKKLLKRPGKPVFLSEVPFEAKHHLIVRRDLRDVGTQPEAADGPPLSDLIKSEVVPTDDTFSAVKQIGPYPGPCHLPEYIQPKIPATALWNQFPDIPIGEKCPIECPHCSQRFSSGQALGGHTSRRHSSKRPGHSFKRLRRLNMISQP